MFTNAINALPEWFPNTLLAKCEKKNLKKKEYLFQLDEKATDIFFVERGEVQALKPLPNGASAILQRSSGNEFFAEADMFFSHYTCDARVTRKAVIYCIPKQGLEEHLKRDNDFSMRFSGLLAANTRKLCSRMERLRINRARDRVLHYLVCESDADKVITLKSSLAYFAEELGLEPETLYRTLSELQKENMINRRGETITLV